MLTVFSLGFARSSSASSPVPVRWRPEEVAVLAVAPIGAIVLPRLMRGKRGGARPPVSPVRRSPVGFTLLTEAFFWLMAFQAIHHFNGHLCKRNKVNLKTMGSFQIAYLSCLHFIFGVHKCTKSVDADAYSRNAAIRNKGRFTHSTNSILVRWGEWHNGIGVLAGVSTRWLANVWHILIRH